MKEVPPFFNFRHNTINRNFITTVSMESRDNIVITVLTSCLWTSTRTLTLEPGIQPVLFVENLTPSFFSPTGVVNWGFASCHRDRQPTLVTNHHRFHSVKTLQRNKSVTKCHCENLTFLHHRGTFDLSMF